MNQQFTGMEHDFDTGMDYFFARNYNRAEGRFIGADEPLLDQYPNDPQSWNLFAYVRNNPLMLVDPDGHLRQCSTVINGKSEVIPCFLAQNQDQKWLPYCGIEGCVPGGDIAGPKPNHPAKPKPDLVQQIETVASCTSGFGSKYSIAGGLHALGIGASDAGGFITDALGGNSFSGVTDLLTSFGHTGMEGGHSVFYNMGQGVVAGPALGVVPGLKGPWGASASGLATDAIAGTAWASVTGAGQTLTTLGGEASLASTAVTAGEFVTGGGIAKIVIDAGIYGAGLAKCLAQ